MNKAQLVTAIAENANLSTGQADKVLDAMLNGIVDTLVNGQDVSLVGFGRFGTKARAARKGRNPQTGNEILIEASNVPYFKAGKELKEQVDTSEG